jgi:hypothetical protein
MVWTHNLKNITYDKAFVPDGAPSSETYDGKFVNPPLFDLSIDQNSQLSL